MTQRDPTRETEEPGGLRLQVDKESLEQLVALANSPRRRSGTPLTLELVLALLGALLAALGLGAWIF